MPLSVRGWAQSFGNKLPGMVAMCAPASAAASTWAIAYAGGDDFDLKP